MESYLPPKNGTTERLPQTLPGSELPPMDPPEKTSEKTMIEIPPLPLSDPGKVPSPATIPPIDLPPVKVPNPKLPPESNGKNPPKPIPPGGGPPVSPVSYPPGYFPPVIITDDPSDGPVREVISASYSLPVPTNGAAGPSGPSGNYVPTRP